MLKRSLALLLFALALPSMHAQTVSVKATLDSTVLLIGQQSLLHLEVSGPASLHYLFPTFPGDTLVKGIEILSRGKLDTVRMENDRIELKTDYLVTSFDSGLYYIPPVKILAGTDTVESNFMGLKVMTFDVDTAKVEIFDIKGVAKPDFVLGDYAVAILTFLLVYILIIMLIWYILRKKYHVEKGVEESNVSLLPPHVVAIMELDRLRTEKLWKKGKNKEYYTELSDVVRKYIERRFQVNALEMTTEEILILFRKDRNTQSVYQNLRQILQTADMVKFAKTEPLESENELSIMNSYLFVNQTKLEEVKSLEEQKEELLKDVEDSPSEEPVAESDDLKKYMPK
jgi:hypothetical protein